MRRIAVSQRCDVIAGRNEVRDALDVEWARILWGLGFLPLPLCSGVEDVGSYLRELSPDAILLSGGNDIGAAIERDRVEQGALRYSEERKLPVLGICRGLQMINHHQGGRLRKVDGHVGVRHLVRGPLVPEGREVNSYHSMGLREEDMGKDLQVAALSPDGLVEALRHRYLSWLAVMWHPEREKQLCPNDQTLILNHLRG